MLVANKKRALFERGGPLSHEPSINSAPPALIIPNTSSEVSIPPISPVTNIWKFPGYSMDIMIY
jgi:hypothetical protein